MKNLINSDKNLDCLRATNALALGKATEKHKEHIATCENCSSDIANKSCGQDELKVSNHMPELVSIKMSPSWDKTLARINNEFELELKQKIDPVKAISITPESSFRSFVLNSALCLLIIACIYLPEKNTGNFEQVQINFVSTSVKKFDRLRTYIGKSETNNDLPKGENQ